MHGDEHSGTLVQSLSRRNPAFSALVINAKKVIRLVRRADQAFDQTAASARYCYSVWLRHLVVARRHGLPTDPTVVAELGPGHSIGVGLAALLTGSDKYFGLDQTAYADLSNNGSILDKLIDLFERRAPIPDQDEFPEIRPNLTSFEFPSDILADDRLAHALRPERIGAIRAILEGRGTIGATIEIRYFAPWDSPAVIDKFSADLIISQAVLEHVGDLAYTYRAMAQWIRPGGWMSHQIDFRCHSTALDWNGHWAYGQRLWPIVNSRSRPINRVPYSRHLALLKAAGFEVVGVVEDLNTEGIRREHLAPEWHDLSDEDLTCQGVLVQARLPAGTSEDNRPTARASG